MLAAMSYGSGAVSCRESLSGTHSGEDWAALQNQEVSIMTHGSSMAICFHRPAYMHTQELNWQTSIFSILIFPKNEFQKL